jgi:hypothetical protein
MAEFKDKLAPPRSVGKVNPPSGIKNPSFDKRTGPTLACGDDYGVGHRVPVGKFDVSNKGGVPMESKCFTCQEAFDGQG